MDSFTDERGTIRDLLAGPIDAVTYIITKAGCVRGNHVHHRTTQWTYVMTGKMLMAGEHIRGGPRVYGPGALVCEPPGLAHAWRAVDDTEVLVFTRGPRSGEAFETDTERLPRDRWLLETLCAACHQPATDDHPLVTTTGGSPAHLACPGGRAHLTWEE